MTDFLQKTGTNGFLTAPFNMMSTELNTLANNASAVSSVGGTSGVFTQTSWGSGIWGVAHFLAGGTFTPGVGGYLAAWFLYSPDGGTSFEKVVSGTDMARPPDFTVPLYNSSHAANDVVQSSGIIRMPWWSTKLFVVNHAGVSLPSSANLIKLGSVAISY
jgi:hypothetical protein